MCHWANKYSVMTAQTNHSGRQERYLTVPLCTGWRVVCNKLSLEVGDTDKSSGCVPQGPSGFLSVPSLKPQVHSLD